MAIRKRISEPRNKPSCPKCGGRMTLRERHSDGEQFWGCVNYPDCKGTEPLDYDEGLDDWDFFNHHGPRD